MRAVFHSSITSRISLPTLIPIPVLGYTIIRLIQNLIEISSRREKKADEIIRSPRAKIAALPIKEQQSLPYPLDILPGARDVDSPYGNTRVYEWGPLDGRKVLFIHGISTPSIALAGLASHLVEHGCRVMLFDLFGRGYSDAPDPTKYPQNIQLFTTQILLALASSELSWTGPQGRFTLVGYSLGGGIAASFTAYMPQLVESLVLIAPSGLLRPYRMEKSGGWLYNNVLPGWMVAWLVRRRMQGDSGPEGSGPKGGSSVEANTVSDPLRIIRAEVPAEDPTLQPNSRSLVLPARKDVSIADAVEWQINAHPGFIESFISSMKHAPITEQHQLWFKIARRQEAVRNGVTSKGPNESLKERKVLILLARKDEVIASEEIESDALATMGLKNVQIVHMDADHTVAVGQAAECAELIVKFWDSPIS